MNRIRMYMLATMTAVLVGAGAFAQVDPPPAADPAGAVTPAQTATPAETATPAQMATPAQTTTTATRNDGFGWGWIGLFGLLGFAGLSGRNARPVEHVSTSPTTRADAKLTPRRDTI